jgi:hypothetical protein
VQVGLYKGLYSYNKPQQQDNAGSKRQTANRGCRKCLITVAERDNLDFDIESHGRHHFSILAQRQKAASLRPSVRTGFYRDLGLAEEESPLYCKFAQHL